MKILVTGFDPFAGEPLNPSWEVARRLPGTIAGADVVAIQLPTSFRRSASALRSAVVAHEPDAVVSLGQAGGRSAVTPERVAINVDDGRIPDNDGVLPIDEPIAPDGPSAYFSTLPVKAMVAAMTEAGVPAGVSNSAGTFVCNHVFYAARHLVEREFPGTTAGFVHLPYLPSQALGRPGTPSLSLDAMVTGLEAGLAAIVAYHGHDDARLVGGAAH
ncbi:pyroglutamyl-peptidase I [Cellulomonas alba]|uniref:Pyrrolidone-carboxylate peptidase n=1 Tax=Cellulomonas alba TaxID=3053467 RepID=A0ABT7SBL8_9CELL|nr:pyroglutamyl-peptidase I [Cellulomonas alba]MDM7853580.1 pyroglutamyl-peptidase I [Cellulomonas alba]